MGEKDFSDRLIAGDQSLTYAPPEAIRAARKAIGDRFARAAVLADLVRLNTLYMIMQAGSGHIGSSFSSTDIITWLWTEALTAPNSGAADASSGRLSNFCVSRKYACRAPYTGRPSAAD